MFILFILFLAFKFLFRFKLEPIHCVLQIKKTNVVGRIKIMINVEFKILQFVYSIFHNCVQSIVNHFALVFACNLDDESKNGANGSNNGALSSKIVRFLQYGMQSDVNDFDSKSTNIVVKNLVLPIQNKWNYAKKSILYTCFCNLAKTHLYCLSRQSYIYIANRLSRVFYKKCPRFFFSRKNVFVESKIALILQYKVTNNKIMLLETLCSL